MRNTLVLFTLLFGLALTPLSAITLDSCDGLFFDGADILIPSCIVGDKVFTDFTYNAQVLAGTGIVDLNVFINPLDADPLNPGIEFQSVWRADANSFIDVAIGFTVSTLSGEDLIKDASLTLAGFEATNPFLGGGEDLCVGGPYPCVAGVNLVGALPAVAGTSSVDWEDTIGPVSVVGVLKDISLDNLNNDASHAEFSIIRQNFSQVPEPGTVALFGLGLMLAGMAARRRRS